MLNTLILSSFFHFLFGKPRGSSGFLVPADFQELICIGHHRSMGYKLVSLKLEPALGRFPLSTHCYIKINTSLPAFKLGDIT
jgi:hypothetical protein